MLTAHNAPFDISFLAAACAGCGLPGPAGPVLDTVALARRLLATGGLAADDVPNCKLSTLAGYFGAPPGPQHRALADARATATVLAGLLSMFSARRVRTVTGLPSRSTLWPGHTPEAEGCESGARGGIR